MVLQRPSSVLRYFIHVSYWRMTASRVASYCSRLPMAYVYRFSALPTESFMILLSLSARLFKPCSLLRRPGALKESSHSLTSFLIYFSSFFYSSRLNFVSNSLAFSVKSIGCSIVIWSSLKLSRKLW